MVMGIIVSQCCNGNDSNLAGKREHGPDLKPRFSTEPQHVPIHLIGDAFRGCGDHIHAKRTEDITDLVRVTARPISWSALAPIGIADERPGGHGTTAER